MVGKVGLDSMPNEILDNICLEFCPHCENLGKGNENDDWKSLYTVIDRRPLLALSLTCKSLQRYAQPRLFHCLGAIKSKNNNNDNDNNNNESNIINSQSLLSTLLNRPDLTNVVRWVDLNGLGSLPTDADTVLNDVASSTSMMTLDMSMTTDGLKYALYQDIILSLLTDVECVYYSVNWSATESECRMVALPRPEPFLGLRFQRLGYPSFLKNLRNLDVKYYGSASEHNLSDPELLNLVAGMPNLTTLRISEIDIGPRHELQCYEALPSVFANLKALHMSGRIQDGDEVYEYLKRCIYSCPKLESFHFISKRPSSYNYSTYLLPVNKLLLALRSNASNLQRLTIQAYDEWNSYRDQRNTLNHDNLRPFDQLKFLSFPDYFSEMSEAVSGDVCDSKHALCRELIPPRLEVLELWVYSPYFKILSCLTHIMNQRKLYNRFSSLREIYLDLQFYAQENPPSENTPPIRDIIKALYKGFRELNVKIVFLVYGECLTQELLFL